VIAIVECDRLIREDELVLGTTGSDYFPKAFRKHSAEEAAPLLHQKHERVLIGD
jgi:hypothetical protein